MAATRSVTLPWLPNGAATNASSRWGIETGNTTARLGTIGGAGIFYMCNLAWTRIDDMVSFQVHENIIQTAWTGTAATAQLVLTVPWVAADTSRFFASWDPISLWSLANTPTVGRAVVAGQITNGASDIRLVTEELRTGTNPNISVGHSFMLDDEQIFTGTHNFSINGVMRIDL